MSQPQMQEKQYKEDEPLKPSRKPVNEHKPDNPEKSNIMIFLMDFCIFC